MRAVNLLTPELRSAQKGSGASRPSAMETSGGIGAFVVLGALALVVAGVAGSVLVQQRGQGPHGAASPRSAPRTTRPSSAPPSSSPTPTSRRSPRSAPRRSRRSPAPASTGSSRCVTSRARCPPTSTSARSRAPSAATAAAAARAPACAAPSAARRPSSSPAAPQSQPAVATLMSRLRNVQGVTRVSLSKSEKATVAAGQLGRDRLRRQPVRQGLAPDLRDRRLLREGRRRRRARRPPPATPPARAAGAAGAPRRRRRDRQGHRRLVGQGFVHPRRDPRRLIP